MIAHLYPGLEPRMGKKVRVLCHRTLPFVGTLRINWVHIAEDKRFCANCIRELDSEELSKSPAMIAVIEDTRFNVRLTRRGWLGEIETLDLSPSAKHVLRDAVNALINGATPPVVSGHEAFELMSRVNDVLRIGNERYRLVKSEYSFTLKLERIFIMRPVKRRPKQKRRALRKAPETDGGTTSG